MFHRFTQAVCAVSLCSFVYTICLAALNSRVRLVDLVSCCMMALCCIANIWMDSCSDAYTRIAR